MERVLSIILENEFSWLFLGMILVGFVVIIISVVFKNNGDKESKESLGVKKVSLDSKEIDEIKRVIFDLYKDVSIARMKFRFNVLEELVDKNLYLEYEKELKELKKNHYKLVATDICLEDFKILSRYVKNNQEKWEVFLHVSQYDYVIDKEKKVVRGTDGDRYQIELKINLVRNTDNKQYIINKMECVGKWIKK